MAKKVQILVNGHDVRQSTAPSSPGRAMYSHNTVKQAFPAGMCVISTQNQADFNCLIMQNKPNSQNPEMNATTFIAKNYNNILRTWSQGKQTQTKPIKPNLKSPSLPKEREEKSVPGEKGKIVRSTCSLTG